MSGGIAFLKKEMLGIIKTYRVWLVPLIFAFLGILSPVSAKFAPALVKAAMEADEAQRQMFGQIKIPEPTVLDAYGQWFKNLSQFGLLTAILISMGSIAGEKAQGTLAIVATKPISRTAVVISKFISNVALIFASVLIGLAACYLYADLLFGKAPLKPLLLSTTAFLTYAVFVLAITLLFSSIAKRQIGAGGLSLLAVFALSVIASLGHGLEKYSPGALLGASMKIASGSQAFSKAIPALVITLAATAAALVAASLVLNRQEI